jgi:hypothetical protein
MGNATTLVAVRRRSRIVGFGRRYEFGDRAKPHKASTRPLPQASLRGTRGLTPLRTAPPPAPCEALLDTPLTGPFHPPRAQRPAPFFGYGRVDGCPVPLPIRLHRQQSVSRRVGEPLHLQGCGQVAQDAVGMAMPQAVPCPGAPPACVGGASSAPGGGTLPEVVRGGVKVHEARGRPSTALGTQAPPPPGRPPCASPPEEGA